MEEKKKVTEALGHTMYPCLGISVLRFAWWVRAQLQSSLRLSHFVHAKHQPCEPGLSHKAATAWLDSLPDTAVHSPSVHMSPKQIKSQYGNHIISVKDIITSHSLGQVQWQELGLNPAVHEQPSFHLCQVSTLHLHNLASWLHHLTFTPDYLICLLLLER